MHANVFLLRELICIFMCFTVCCVTFGSVSCSGLTLALLWCGKLAVVFAVFREALYHAPLELDLLWTCRSWCRAAPGPRGPCCFSLEVKDAGGWMGGCEQSAVWIWCFGGQRCGPQTVGWECLGWAVSGVLPSFRALQGLLSSPSCFLVKPQEGEFWKSLCVDSWHCFCLPTYSQFLFQGDSYTSRGQNFFPLN